MFEAQESVGQGKQASLRFVRLTYGFVFVVAAVDVAIEIYRHALAKPLSLAAATVVLVLNLTWLVTAKKTPLKSLNAKVFLSFIILSFPNWIHDIFFP